MLRTFSNPLFDKYTNCNYRDKSKNKIQRVGGVITGKERKTWFCMKPFRDNKKPSCCGPSVIHSLINILIYFIYFQNINCNTV